MNDISKAYTIKELEKLLSVEKDRIGEVFEQHPDLQEAHCFLHPETDGPIYRQGDSILYVDEEGARFIAEKLGMDPGLVVKV